MSQNPYHSVDITPTDPDRQFYAGENADIPFTVKTNAEALADPASLRVTLRMRGVADPHDDGATDWDGATWTDGSGATQGGITRTAVGTFLISPKPDADETWLLDIEGVLGGKTFIAEMHFRVFRRHAQPTV